MPYGHLTPEQRIVLATHVKDDSVVDAGAGDLVLARDLLDLGAWEVVAVEPKIETELVPRGIRLIKAYLQDFHETNPVAFFSWPCNWYDQGTLHFCQRTPKIIVLAKTTDGTMCGDNVLWDHLCGREVLAYVPDRKNTLVVYGEKLVRRPMNGLERGGFSENVLSYEDTES